MHSAMLRWHLWAGRLLILLVLSGCGNQERVQRGKALVSQTTPVERATFLTKQMTQALHLNEGQSARVSTINLSFATKAEVIMMSSVSAPRKRRRFRNLLAERDLALLKVLSVDQYKAYQDTRDSWEKQYLEEGN